MQFSDTNVFARDDTFFGVCEAIGQDFGFHGNWLRIPLALGLFWNPMAILGTYAALAAIVIVSRLLVREPREVLSELPAGASDQSIQQQSAASENSELEQVPLAA